MTISKYERAALELQKAQIEQRKREIVEGLPYLYGHKWYAWQRQFFESRNKMTLLTAANQVGKALLDDVEIPTPTGFIRMGDLSVGDTVFGRDGKESKVISVPFRGEDECYRITFCDGSTVVASGDHEWVCKTSRQRFRKEYQNGWTGETFKNQDFDCWVKLTTKEIIESGAYKPEAPNPGRRVSIPICEPVHFREGALLDPYMIGLLLGNGGLTQDSVILTSADEEIISYVKKNYSVTETGRFGLRIKGLAFEMRLLGMMGSGSKNKRIPPEYLQASYADRLALIRGLMDTDGSIYGKRTMEYCTISEGLKDDFIELATSLGATCKVKRRSSGYRDKNGDFIKCNDSFRIILKSTFCPFKSSRKASRFYNISRRHERLIYKIEPVGKQKCSCITVDNHDGTFLATRDYIVTHNSTVQIWKTIHWATCQKLWPELWSDRPQLFWYLYPNADVVSREFRLKWKSWLPRGKYKDSSDYGWTVDGTRNEREVKGIEFKNGVLLEFKTYSQNVHDLQAGTVAYMPTDEELPEELWDELSQRLSATKGYFSAVFTATRGQQMWYRAMEGKDDNELFPDALKLQVSKFDCTVFDDGSLGRYTEEDIKAEIANCRSKATAQVRIFGKFGAEEGRKYWAFDPTRHYIKPKPIPSDWKLYASVDIGSGGAKGHPAAITFLAVRPDFRLGYLFDAWRGDGIETTASDILEKFRQMRGKLAFTSQCFDWASREFGLIAQRAGEGFTPAEKSNVLGEEALNTLYQNNMLFLFDIPELRKLGAEMMSLMVKHAKQSASDDLCDSSRYNILQVPWDWTTLVGERTEEEKALLNTPQSETKEEAKARELDERRGIYKDRKQQTGWHDVEEDIAYWNDQYSAE